MKWLLVLVVALVGCAGKVESGTRTVRVEIPVAVPCFQYPEYWVVPPSYCSIIFFAAVVACFANARISAIYPQ